MPRFGEWKNNSDRVPLSRGMVVDQGVGWKEKDLIIGDNLTPRLSGTPLDRGASERGWNWKWEEETSSYHGHYYVPEKIEQYDERVVWYEKAAENIDRVIDGILQCEITGKLYKIIKQELAFYIKNNIQIPRKHPDQRHRERMEMRNPRKLHEDNCSECHKPTMTTYTPWKSEKVVCEECYRKLVY